MSVAEDERGSTLREIQKAETRSRVVEAARRLFSEKGYEAATIRDIARMAGVAPGSVFTTFDSKTELMQEIIFARYQEMLPEVIAAAKSGETGRDRLKAGLGKAYEVELRELRLVSETIAASYRWSEAEERENRSRLAPLFSILLDLIRWSVERGELKSGLEPAALAEILFSCYVRNFRRALFDKYDAARLAATMAAQIDIIFDGAAAA